MADRLEPPTRFRKWLASCRWPSVALLDKASIFDVIIVGGGPAGLSAALMLGRCRRRVAICDEGRQRNLVSQSSHGFFTRDGEAQRMDANTKWSAFYGPEGLMTILVFHRNFHKVHGSQDTVMSLVY